MKIGSGLMIGGGLLATIGGSNRFEEGRGTLFTVGILAVKRDIDWGFKTLTITLLAFLKLHNHEALLLVLRL